MNVKAYNDLIERYADIVRLGQIGSMLMWDLNTYMPPEAVDMRGDQQSLVSGIAHERLTSREMGKLLETLSKIELPLKKAAVVREIKRNHDRAASIPRHLIRELSRMEPVATGRWVKAKEKSDFSIFRDVLERFLELKKQVAEYVGYDDSPYDALIDEYEPYMKSEKLARTFGDLGGKLKPIVAKLTEVCSEYDEDKLIRKYPIEIQKVLFQSILLKMGYDMGRGRVDISAHPFTSGSLDDVRITLRYDESDLRPGLFSSIHEGGHALYEQGFLKENYMTPLAESVSLGIHESQSRLWENIVGRSRPFWEAFYPELQNAFPSMKNVSLDEFHRAINHISNTPVRVDADEVTYSMHILVRFEIEKDLVENKMEVTDIPQVWNELYRRYLGIEPKNDSLGCLQDIHWAMGAVGYFPTYTLGNLYSAQFFDAASKEIGDLEGSIGNGNLKPLLSWLRSNIHSYGKLYTADDLVKKVTGESLSEDHFINYLKKKYSNIYDIDL
jgi:carboxypeptidase Taq